MKFILFYMIMNIPKLSKNSRLDDIVSFFIPEFYQVLLADARENGEFNPLNAYRY